MNNDRFLVRGKTAKGNWFYGAYHKHLPYTPASLTDGKDEEKIEKDYKHIIIQDSFSDWNMPRGIVCIEVVPETVGMCTGKKDKHNCLIFENDRLRITLPIKNIEKPIIFEGIVKYMESSFRLCCSRNENPRIDDFSQDCVFEVLENK